MALRSIDLMIGDWVNTPDSISRVIYIAKYSGIYTDNTNIGEKLYSPNEINPIPLTPEILEKNGFHYTNEHTLKGADTYILRIEQRGFDLKVTIKLNDYFALDSYDDRVYRLAEISTGKWYVHHLQHTLRLCGIDKEITI